MTTARMAAAIAVALVLATGPSLAYSEAASRKPPAAQPPDPALASAPPQQELGDHKAAMITLLLMLARERAVR